MSDMRWEPVGYTLIADAEGEYLAKLIYHDESEVGTPYFETNREYPLPTMLRLCRAVAAPEPDWSKAPEWAAWWAEDGDGVQRWFEHEPKPSQYNEWESPWSRNSVIQRTPHWRTTLRKRPEVGP